MRWLALTILAAFILGADLPPSTQPGIIVSGWLVPEPGPGQVLVLGYDPSGTYITSARILSRWDANQDGYVDLWDFALFQAAYTGPK